MRLRSQLYRCLDCGATESRIVELADGVASSMDSCPIDTCSHCGGTSTPTISAPRIMHNSVPDGFSRGGDWARTREVERLRSASFDLPPERRGELHSEMDRLQSHLINKPQPDRGAGILKGAVGRDARGGATDFTRRAATAPEVATPTTEGEKYDGPRR